MHVISETAELTQACHALAEGPFVCVDTEFMRETTYWPRLCLVQAASPAAEALIDPMAPGIDLAPFLALMANPAVLKVFHAARQDLEIFYNLMGALPAPVFDTQIGAMACGYGDSIAYDGLVQAVLKKRIDKSSRFTDWSRRPLSEAQLSYALADVTHLRALYPKLADYLSAHGRTHWLDEEHAALTDPANFDTSPENAWKRLKLRKPTPDYVLALQVAAAWRERQAQARDAPRARVLKDDALYEIAEQRPRTPEAFDRLRVVPRGFARSRGGAELVVALDAALAAPERPVLRTERPAPPPHGVGPTAELLKVLLRHEAERQGVAPRLIANSADIDAIAASDEADVAALRGWRLDVFGQRALALKHGRIALTLKDGKVAIEELG
ncbi:MAG: ribonuclease D [Hyphomonadaceae bacterium]